MSFGRAELKQLIQEQITSHGVDPWRYRILESKDLEEDLTEEEELEEVSSMAGGAVAGGVGAGPWGEPEDDVVVADKWSKLREAIRDIALEIIRENTERYLAQENKLRQYIRSVLTEKTSATANPHHMTGINVLQNLLANIIPGAVESAYKSLTTSEEQREGFRTQLKHLVQNLLEMEGMNKVAGTDQDGDGDLDEELVGDEETPEKEVQPLKVVTDDDPFIDVYGDDEKELGEFQRSDKYPEAGAEEEDDQLVISIDPTGRGKAVETFGKIEKQIRSEFGKLSDPRDIEVFGKYMLINLDMYMDKFEDEVSQSLAQIDAEPGPGDVVDTEDGLGSGEMAQGADDELMPDDLEEEWKDAQETVVEFYSTAGTVEPTYGVEYSDEDEDNLAHFPHR